MKAALFYLLYGFLWIFTLLPISFQYRVSSLLYYIVYYIVRYRKKIVFHNLRNAFPLKKEDEINLIAKNYFRHLCDELLEAFQLIHVSGENLLKRFSYKNPEILQEYFLQKRSIVAVFGHYGNWEWMAGIPLVTAYKVIAIYRPLSNAYFDKLMIKFRCKFGINAVAANRILPEVISNHQQKLPALTLFLGDQVPAGKYIQYWTKFLNQDTPVYLGAEKISVKFDQVVVYIKIRKVKRGFYEAEFIPLAEKPKETKPCEITEKHLRMLENDIIEKPEYWMWSHRRWKHKRITDD